MKFDVLDAVFESFKNLFNNVVEILRPISIRNSLTQDLQSIQKIKISEKPTNIKELTKRIQRISHAQSSSGSNKKTTQIQPERINPRLQFALPLNTVLPEKSNVRDEFHHLENKLQYMNQKIENEIKKQVNSLEKANSLDLKNRAVLKTCDLITQEAKKSLHLNNYNSFSCVSEMVGGQKEEYAPSEKFEMNNTFQIENIDYEQFKSNLEKEIEETEPNQRETTNMNFEQISDIHE